ncbi:MAG: hypothetical protein A2374_02645 [Candidatus Moranbacteria bacterium RIFOXYB1_FULL_44_23]|nr:MAG: hypothetical protein A2194_00485 [Candidatus Moranbacteria bacterium RIFOXYA1_FULL_44_8]OGI39945.1 MAG: hypothetical protein A2374_02645 [Candidatus Moranbacteria bacterium RIFOXYB1_FULL_44_23]OGI41372.1 MAG: hypothetical protein A2593_01340 [Candidatus Moranbacteria bacterium RIFOXYD1_FULL_44_9]HBB37290.1 hypothetical protein [Candidatus Moranbacteria bacterium]HBU25628.1 hypothetical protein [Candidatus Moranbacteria bacterium]
MKTQYFLANEFQSQFPPICDWNSLAFLFLLPNAEGVKNKNKNSCPAPFLRKYPAQKNHCGKTVRG